MAKGSHQKKIAKHRKPRVQIEFDVDIGDAQLQINLPFVVGVMGDFSGDPTKELSSLDDRKFSQIDRNNFDDVLRNMNPGLQYRVENTLGDGSDELAVDLKFEAMEDFDPIRVAEQIPALKKLLDTRGKLRDLISKIDRSKDLESLLNNVLQNQGDLEKLGAELGIGGGDDSAPATDAEPVAEAAGDSE